MIWRRVKQGFMGIMMTAMALLAVGLVYSRATHMQFLSIQTGSMVPALSKGDLVIVHRVPLAQLAKGDVITFVSPKDPRATTTHRIVALPSPETANHIITKGDANPVADTPILPQAVLGKVQAQVPLLGRAVDSVRTPLGLLILIYVPALTIIAGEFRRLVAYYKKQVWRAPWRGEGRQLDVRKIAVGLQVVAIVSIGALAAWPAQAALQTVGELAGNSISTAAIAPLSHIMIRELAFECSLDNTGTANRLPGIVFYNPGTADTSTGGWYVQSSEGKLLTFRSQTVFDAKDNYDIEPDLKNGINYAGDYLALFDASGKLVDGISWGSDTTYLNPALPSARPGATFRRISLVTDTDQAIDWAVSVSECLAARPE